jgi:hypothetical protein
MNENQKSDLPKSKKIPFWRLGFGLILLLGAARGYLAPGPELNPPTNSAEKQGQDAGKVILLLGGAWLILTFIHSTTKKSDQ